MIKFAADPLFWQRFLQGTGFYAGNLDGNFGPKSLAAAAAFAAHSESIAEELGRFAPRTEDRLLTLQPTAQRLARRHLQLLQKHLPLTGSCFHILSGTRTYAEQEALFAQGRSAPGPVVTRARGGQSNHNFGLAWDLGVFRGSEYLPESPLYQEAGRLAKLLDLEWGGDWKSLPDEPHFQLSSGHTLTAIRDRFEAGQPLLA